MFLLKKIVSFFKKRKEVSWKNLEKLLRENPDLEVVKVIDKYLVMVPSEKLGIWRHDSFEKILKKGRKYGLFPVSEKSFSQHVDFWNLKTVCIVRDSFIYLVDDYYLAYTILKKDVKNNNFNGCIFRFQIGK